MPTARRAFASLALLTAALTIVASIALAQTEAEKAAPAAEKGPAAPDTGKTDTGKRGNPQIPRTGVLHPEYNAALPTLFLIGDSTVKNSWDAGSDGLWGWGRPIAAYFDTSKINVENQALGGTSSRSYYTTGHWERVSKLIKPGDFVLMQFGHNDGAAGGRSSIRGNGDDTRSEDVKGTSETVHSFGWYLRQFIAETKAKGATPIVCSLIPRNNWRDDKVNRATGSYATWAAEAAKQTDTPFIDLNGIIADHYDQLGKDAVKAFFPKETTHPGWRGASFNAECVVEGLRKLPDCKLKDYLRETPAPMAKPSTDPTDG